MRTNAGDKNASNAQDKAIADAYKNKFIIPLDFEMLNSAAPYYPAGLGNRLCYELTFNDYNRVTEPRVSSPKFQMRLLLNPTSRDLLGLNTSRWPCCMAEFSDIEKL